MLGVADVASSGKLIAFLAVLASTLAIALSGYRGVAAVLPSYPARSQDDIDGAQYVLVTVAVVLNSSGV
jgi:hypothetical protein